jgi:Flp pilus assembly protein protease CpaA
MLEIAADISLILLSIYICVSDIRFHRIPNRSLIFLSCSFIPSIKLTPFGMMALLIAILWLLGWLANIGPGDLKLLTILICMQGEIILNPLMWIFFLAIASISVLVHIILKGTLKGEIPLAPAIVIPFTALYLSF